jgi:hypothetical protein
MPSPYLPTQPSLAEAEPCVEGGVKAVLHLMLQHDDLEMMRGVYVCVYGIYVCIYVCAYVCR